MTLEEINLGDVHGEEESRHPDFLENYYVREKIIKQALNPSICVILGRQGSGKTILSYYIKQKFSSSENFIERVSFGDLTISTLSPKNVQVAEADYFHIFEWTFLVELSKIILKDNSLTSTESNSLRAVLLYITQNFSLHKKAINQILGSGLEFTSPIGGVKLNKNINKENLPIVTEELKLLIAPLLQESKNRFLIYIDDIDDHLKMTNMGMKILNGMVNASYKINFFIRDNNPNSKIALLLRSDMFFKLNNANINKIRESHSIHLNWNRTYKWNDSHLAHMIAQKIRNSFWEELKSEDDVFILKKFFHYKIYPQDSKNDRPVFTGEFLLSRTFFRPREIVKFLNIAQNKFPDEDSFSSHSIYHSERPYSYWLKKEIEAEMSTHMHNNKIQELFNLLILFNKRFFIYSELKNFLEREEKELEFFTLEEALKTLFRFGVLYQSYKPVKGKGKKRFFLHSYVSSGEHQSEHPNFLKNHFHLHYGLYKSILTTNDI